MNKPYYVFARNTTPEEPHNGWYFGRGEEIPPRGPYYSKREAQEALDKWRCQAETPHSKEQQ